MFSHIHQLIRDRDYLNKILGTKDFKVMLIIIGSSSVSVGCNWFNW